MSQSVHSNLKKEEDIKRFKKITSLLMCQCGCNMVLMQCNHQTCMAWSMRSVIDQLIEKKYSNEYIIEGFINGFKKSVETDSEFESLRNGIYKEYVPKYTAGFGREILSTPQNDNFGIVILAFSFLLIIIVIAFIRSKKKVILNKNTISIEKEEHKQLHKSLYE